jgi:transposase InsO family protein
MLTEPENVVCPLRNILNEARSTIFEWIEVFYNRERLHETLDYISPVRYEERRAVP